jgi:hypothetical protein
MPNNPALWCFTELHAHRGDNGSVLQREAAGALTCAAHLASPSEGRDHFEIACYDLRPWNDDRAYWSRWTLPDIAVAEPPVLPNVKPMPERKAPPPKPSRAGGVLVEMVEERIAAGGVDAATLASLIAESLVDLILLVPEEEQAKLMAHTLSSLGDLFLQKSGADGGGSGSTH